MTCKRPCLGAVKGNRPIVYFLFYAVSWTTSFNSSSVRGPPHHPPTAHLPPTLSPPPPSSPPPPPPPRVTPGFASAVLTHFLAISGSDFPFSARRLLFLRTKTRPAAPFCPLPFIRRNAISLQHLTQVRLLDKKKEHSLPISLKFNKSESWVFYS